MSTVSSLPGLDIDFPKKAPPPGVKRITTYIYKKEEGKVPTSVLRFDEQRREKEKHVFTQDGELRWTITYRYNEAGDIEEEKAFDTDDNPVWRKKYKYDSQGRLLQETHYNKNDSPDYMVIKEYQNDRTEILAYDTEGSLRWRQKIIDDEEGGEREIFYYYPDGNRIKGVIKEFDRQNRLFSETHIDQIGAVFRRIETEYDILGRLSERIVYDHRDEIHRKISISYLSDGHPSHIRQVFPQENREEEIVYEYRFNNRGAWNYKETIVSLKENNDQKNIVTHIIEYRDIEYYQYGRGVEQ